MLGGLSAPLLGKVRISRAWGNGENEMKRIAWRGLGVALAGIALGTPLLAKGEIIVIHGKCPTGTVSVPGDCVSNALFDFLTNNHLTGGITPPGGGTGPGVGGGGSTPTPPKKPTEEECKEDYKDCVDTVRNDRLECIKDKEYDATQQVWSGLGCFGEEQVLAYGIEVAVGDAPFPRPPEIHDCSLSDIQGPANTPAGQSPDPTQLRCLFRFMQRAYPRCMMGLPKGSQTVGGSISVSVPPIGAEGHTSTTIELPGGVGAHDYCNAIARGRSDACMDKKNRCVAQARGTSPASLPITVAVLLSRIDRVKLGLPTSSGHLGAGTVAPLMGFRDTPKLPGEVTDLYIKRLAFLAAWSQFLNSEGTSATLQRDVENSFANAQRAYEKVLNDYLPISTNAHVPNPDATRGSFTQAISAWRAFLETDQFTLRWNQVEANLMQALGTQLGASARDRFKTNVWPGIQIFGAAAPMILPPIQITQQP